MRLNEIFPYFAVVAFLSSIIFFVLAKGAKFPERCLAAIHGWAALSIIPFASLIGSRFPSLSPSVGMFALLLLGGLSGVSIFYAIATVKVRWAWHLLHVPTVFVAISGLLLSLLVLGGHP